MFSTSDFFSKEALELLRLAASPLEDSALTNADYEELARSVFSESLSTTASGTEGCETLPSASVSRANEPQSMFHCFSIGDGKLSKPKRRRFSQKRRQEVHAVRNRGACLRCRLLKQPVGYSMFQNVLWSVEP